MNFFKKLPMFLTCIGLQGCIFCLYSKLQYRSASLETLEPNVISSNIKLPSQLIVLGNISSLFLFIGLLYFLENLSVLKNKSHENLAEKSVEEILVKSTALNNTKAKHLKHFLQSRIPKCPYKCTV